LARFEPPNSQPLRCLALACCILVAACAAPACEAPTQAADQARFLLWQTNSGGDDIHIFDAETGALVHRLVVGPEPHGLAATADNRTVFVTLEANGQPRGELIWIDAASFEITRRIEICREPHALVATPDGRWLYVPCRDGRYWVINGETGQVVQRIETGGRPHNTQVSRDGRWAYLSPMGAPDAVTIIDVEAGHAVAGEIAFTDAPRPAALSADGRWLAQHVDGLNGFEVADTETQQVVATIEHSTPLDGFMPMGSLGRLGFGGFERCHGLSIRPDQTEIWSVCGDTLTIHTFNPPSFTELAAIALPSKGYWLTFAPDSHYAYVALADAGEVAVIDGVSREIVMRLRAGAAPKRNIVLRRVAS
jgi:DNA-binding beta-propeller fold protein YncE